MQWTSEAEAAVKKVPFFVRKRVRARVENEARGAGKTTVTLADVKTTQARYLKNMAKEVKGYQVETCFGPSGCPHRAHAGDMLLERIESLLKSQDLRTFLASRVEGELKFHHEFRVTLADCPNACSQPQIKDIGIIGACLPVVTDAECTRCEACIDACRENAVCLDPIVDAPMVDAERCLACGQCMAVCPTGTLTSGEKGFRVLLGGKLGRHPRLARELPGIYNPERVLRIVEDCLAFYKQNSRRGERFSQLLGDSDFQALARRHGPK